MKSEFVVKELSTAELQERLDAERVELNKMKMNHHISPLENPNLIKCLLYTSDDDDEYRGVDLGCRRII